jgi:outer membrane protein assembly factor BamE (lipoprotein component of BamABCDE complex)
MKHPLKPVQIIVLGILLTAASIAGCFEADPGSQTVKPAASKGESTPIPTSSTKKKSLRYYKELLKVGMSRQEVINHLGNGWERGARIIYDLGSRSMGPDIDILTIEFDANDKLVQYRITRG